VVSSGAQLLAGVDFDDPQFERRPYDPLIAYAQSKTADVLLAVGISRRWAEDGIGANACAPGVIRTNLLRHLDAATLQALGAMDADGNVLTPDYFKTPEQGAATSTLLAASPLLEGVTGRYFEDNQEAEVVEGSPALMAGGPGAMVGVVAKWSVDPVAADRLWEYALTATRNAV
jgi:NAD(P)-dependent dehydrogenase (short-subunit alcohol dehydrogenase family)